MPRVQYFSATGLVTLAQYHIMPAITDLPFELWSEITLNVISKKDLCRLRSVNSTFNILATPAVFYEIKVRNDDQIAERFWTLVHTPHIAQHVQSIVYVEKQIVEKLNTLKNIESSYCRKSIWMLLKLAFSNLHRFPSLKKLALYFDVRYHPVVPFDSCGYPSYNVVREIGNSHQWDVLHAIGNNREPLPGLHSFEIYGWHCSSDFSSLFDEAPIARLIASLRHLRFSLPLVRPEDSVSREQIWKQVVMRRLLQPAVNLESLKLSRSHAWDNKQFLNTSQVQLTTYPRLTVLSLWGIAWEDGKIGQGGIIMPPPLEDFIMRHRKTLRKLNIDNCSINVGGRSRLPFCYWADVYKRLTEAMTELIEVEVESLFNPHESSYVYSVGGTYRPVESLAETERLEGREQDRLALEKFRAVVQKRRTGEGFDHEAKQ